MRTPRFLSALVPSLARRTMVSPVEEVTAALSKALTEPWRPKYRGFSRPYFEAYTSMHRLDHFFAHAGFQVWLAYYIATEPRSDPAGANLVILDQLTDAELNKIATHVAGVIPHAGNDVQKFMKDAHEAVFASGQKRKRPGQHAVYHVRTFKANLDL